MSFQNQYANAKEKLLSDESICQENRDIFKQFFDYQEYRLKRMNGFSELDEACYKTVYAYVGRLRIVNGWFRNMPWVDLTRDDIQKVYDDLEDGVIRNRKGEKYADRGGYYSRIFKGKPFRLAGKSELAKEVLEYHTERKDSDVRFVTEEEFLKLVSVVSNPHHLALLWLQWDVGENIGTLLQLARRDFSRQINQHTHEPEYLVNLPRGKIKRARKTRTEPTLYAETIRYLDMVLEGLEPDDRPFSFGHRQALKVMHSAVKRSKARCMPNGDGVRWKDLRSGMASHLLKKGWTSDEVNARLGHSPGSKALNAYINYLALDRERPKQRLYESSVTGLKAELEESRSRERIISTRYDQQQTRTEQMFGELEAIKRVVNELCGAVAQAKVSA